MATQRPSRASTCVPVHTAQSHRSTTLHGQRESPPLGRHGLHVSGPAAARLLPPRHRVPELTAALQTVQIGRPRSAAGPQVHCATSRPDGRARPPRRAVRRQVPQAQVSLGGRWAAERRGSSRAGSREAQSTAFPRCFDRPSSRSAAPARLSSCCALDAQTARGGGRWNWDVERAPEIRKVAWRCRSRGDGRLKSWVESS